MSEAPLPPRPPHRCPACAGRASFTRPHRLEAFGRRPEAFGWQSIGGCAAIAVIAGAQ